MLAARGHFPPEAESERAASFFYFYYFSVFLQKNFH